MKNKNGFTLVELLAVIAILAILVILALPNVIKLYNNARQEAFLTEVKGLANTAEKRYLQDQISGKNTNKFSHNNNKLDMTGEKLEYCVILNNQGKVKDLKASNGTWIVTLPSGKEVADLTRSDLIEGNLDNYNCGEEVESGSKVEAYECSYDGELVQGAEYVNGQYTYRYNQYWHEDSSFSQWDNTNFDGWGIKLTDKESTDPVTSKICTTINGKQIKYAMSLYRNSNASSIDVSSFDTSSVYSMAFMFYGSKATEIKGLENFDTRNVINMSFIFYNSQAKELNLNSFDTSKITSMSSMFQGSQAEKINVTGFKTQNVTDMNSMFYNANATEIKGLESFDTRNVTNMSSMFHSSNALALNLESFDTSKVTDMSYMFYGSKATSLDLAKFNTKNVKNITGMFRGSEATEIKNMKNFDLSNTTSMEKMFYNSKVTELDLSGFKTDTIKNMSYLFTNSPIEKLNISNINTSNVENMFGMFSGLELSTIDVSMLNTENVTNMNSMFRANKATEIKGLENFDTSNVTDMGYMFTGNNLNELDLSSFDTSKVTDMSYMFDQQKNLKTIYASDKFVVNATNHKYMFNNCTSIVGGNGTGFKFAYRDGTYARIDKSDTPGYFTLKAN